LIQAAACVVMALLFKLDAIASIGGKAKHVQVVH
jgi:hypothetical protein